MKMNRYLQVPYITLSLLILTGLGGVLAAVWWWLWTPMVDHHAGGARQTADLRQTLASNRSRIAMTQQATELSAALDMLDAKRAKTATQADLIAEVGTLIRRSNVAILHSDNVLDTQSGDANWFRQDITIEGTYPAIRYFLQLVGNTDHLTLIEQVDWSQGRSRTEQKARIRLATLFSKTGGQE